MKLILLNLMLALSFYCVNLKSKEITEFNWIGCGITKKAFMTPMSKEYERITGIKINLNGGGATKGIRKISSNEMDIGGSCRYKLEGSILEKSAQMHPVAWDALVIVVNKDNPVNNLSTEQLKKIYLGKIKTWSEIGGLDRPIDLLIRKGNISGVGHTLRKLIFTDSKIKFKNAKVFPSTGPLEKSILSNQQAIGVTGISSARKRNLKILDLDGKKPTYENIKNGTYSLYRTLYLVSNKNNPNYAEILKFIKFAQSAKGRKIIRDNKVVPYMDGLNLLAKQIKQDLKAYKSGY